MDKPRSSDSNQLSATARVNHAAGVSSDFAALFEDETDTDVVIKVGDATFRVHRIVLKARCGYLNKKAVENLPHHELELTDTLPHVFKKMLQYIYTGKLTLCGLNRQDTLGLFQLAGLYGFSRLQESIAAQLTQEVTKENAVAMLKYVIAHPNDALQSLEQHALRCIVSRGVEFLENPEFLELSVDCVERLLRCWWDVPKQELNKPLQRWVENNGTTGEKLEQLLSVIDEMSPKKSLLGALKFRQFDSYASYERASPNFFFDRSRNRREKMQQLPKLNYYDPDDEVAHKLFVRPIWEFLTKLNAEKYTGRNATRPLDANRSGSPSKMTTTEHTLNKDFHLKPNFSDNEVASKNTSAILSGSRITGEMLYQLLSERSLPGMSPRKRLLGELLSELETCAGIKAEYYTGRNSTRPGSSRDDPSPLGIAFASDANVFGNPSKMKTSEHTLDDHFDLIINDPDDEVDPETASSSNAVLETRAETASCSFFEKRLNIAQQEKCRPIFQPGSLLDDPSPFKLILMNDPNRNENPNKMKTTDYSDEDEHEDWNEDLIFQLDDCGSNGSNEDWDHHFQMDLL